MISDLLLVGAAMVPSSSPGDRGKLGLRVRERLHRGL